MQVGTTWELGSVPYLPAVNNVAEHCVRLRALGVDGVMLGWTLGGYPSPNLEAAARVLDGATPEAALRSVAERRFTASHAADVLDAWRQFSDALAEYPYHGSVVYAAPHHMGPANLLWAAPTGYAATMVGLPYDDLNSWRGVYPAEVLAAQFAKVADGFDRGVAVLSEAAANADSGESRTALEQEADVAEAASLHFRSTANQVRFVLAHVRLAGVRGDAAAAVCDEIERLLRAEIELACRLHAIQSRDSRIGFEATNQYYFVPVDLAEKVLNCRDLLERWLPEQRHSLSP